MSMRAGNRDSEFGIRKSKGGRTSGFPESRIPNPESRICIPHSPFQAPGAAA